jgi:hypothetical protein
MKQIYAATLILFFFLAAQLQLSPKVSSAAQNPDPASFASCGVRTSDIAIPTSGAEIQDIVTRYVADPTCNSRLRTAIENILRDEHRDGKWAGPLEQIVKEEALARGAKIAGVCHTSLCRYDIELNPSMESARSPHEVEHRVISATAGTPLQVDSLQYYGSNFKFTIFLYSTVAPAAFLEPLRKQMEPAD